MVESQQTSLAKHFSLPEGNLGLFERDNLLPKGEMTLDKVLEIATRQTEHSIALNSLLTSSQKREDSCT